MPIYRLQTSIFSQLFGPMFALVSIASLAVAYRSGQIPWLPRLETVNHHIVFWKLALAFAGAAVWWLVDRFKKPHAIALDDDGTARFYRHLVRPKTFLPLDIRSIERRPGTLLITGVLGDTLELYDFPESFELLGALSERNPEIELTELPPGEARARATVGGDRQAAGRVRRRAVEGAGSVD